MRFSIKWLLAAVTYAAVVCASVTYAGSWWNRVLTLCLVVAWVVAALGAVVRRGRTQAFCAGFAILLFVAHAAFGRSLEIKISNGGISVSDGAYTERIPRLSDLGTVVSEMFERRLLHFASQQEDVLTVAQRIASQYANQVQGASVVAVLGMEIEKRERGIVFLSALLDKEVALQGGSRSAQQRLPITAEMLPQVAWTKHAQVAIVQHLIFLLSLLGGLLGLWFWKREQKANAPAGAKET